MNHSADEIEDMKNTMLAYHYKTEKELKRLSARQVCNCYDAFMALNIERGAVVLCRK